MGYIILQYSTVQYIDKNDVEERETLMMYEKEEIMAHICIK